MRIRSILFPTDFSISAGYAIPHVKTMARKFEAEVTVLHIRVPYADDPERPHYLFVNEERYAGYVEAQLEKVRADLKPLRRVATVTSKAASPAIGLLNQLERNPVNLVIMGTHGRSALGRFLLGTVAEKVVRHARCPVLTVAGNRENYRGDPNFRRILAPSDFSEDSMEAVHYADKLADKFDADLEVLYVLTREAGPYYYGLPEIKEEEGLRDLAGQAKDALGARLAERGLTGLTAHVQVGSSGSGASEAIVGFARQMPVDLIVLAARGLTGIDHALMGSTTERVVRMAPCPVLTVHQGRV